MPRKCLCHSILKVSGKDIIFIYNMCLYLTWYCKQITNYESTNSTRCQNLLFQWCYHSLEVLHKFERATIYCFRAFQCANQNTTSKKIKTAHNSYFRKALVVIGLFDLHMVHHSLLEFKIPELRELWELCFLHWITINSTINEKQYEFSHSSTILFI